MHGSEPYESYSEANFMTALKMACFVVKSSCKEKNGRKERGKSLWAFGEMLSEAYNIFYCI